MHLRPRIAAGIAGLALLGAFGTAARADVLRLENGRILHGTVERGYVDPQCMKVQLFTTGGIVKVRWDHLISEDRDRWQVDLGLRQSEESQELKIDGHKITFANASSMQGLVLNPQDLAPGSTVDIRIQSKGKEVAYPRGQVAAVQPARVDLLVVYTPRQAYEIKKAEISPNNGPGHSDLADYARVVYAYEEAREHYLEAQNDADFMKTPQGKQIESKLATMEILIRNRALADDLAAVRVTLLQAKGASSFLMAAKFYLDARDEMYRLSVQYPDKKIQAEFKMQDLAMQVEIARRTFFEKRLPAEVYRRLRQMAYDKARESKVKDFPQEMDRQERARLEAKGTFEGAKQYFTRDFKDDLWNGVMKDVGASAQIEKLKAAAAKPGAVLSDDEKRQLERLTKMEGSLRKELDRYWKDRDMSGFIVTSFGYGSFIVVGTTLKLQRKQPTTGGQGGGRGGRGGGGGGGSQQQAQDVIKTPDEWWEGASAQEKVNWLLSWCAVSNDSGAGTTTNDGGFLKVARSLDVDCDSCAGLGYKKVNVASTGEEEATRCTTCNGCKVVRKIRWR